MRKSYLVCAVLLIVSLTAGLLTSAAASEPIDDVTVELRTVAGDPSATEGLVRYSIHSYDTLFWRSRVELGAQPQIDSDFRMFIQCSLGHDKAKEWLATSLTGGAEAWLDWDKEEQKRWKLEEKDMTLQDNTFNGDMRQHIEEEIAAQLQPGETKTVVLQVSDYFDYYAYQIIDGTYYRWYYDEDDSGVEPSYGDYLIRRPVEEGFCVAVTVSVGQDGYPSSVTWDDNYYYNQLYAEEYAVNQHGAANTEMAAPSDEEFLYGFGGVQLESAAAANGTFVVVGLVEGLRAQATQDWFPRGYGLFYVPWEDHTFKNHSYYSNGEMVTTMPVPCYDKMELVYPMVWGEESLLYLTATPDGRSAQMVTRSGEGLWLTSLSDGGQVLQRQLLPQEITEAGGLTINAYEDFLVVMDDVGEFAVYSLDERGAARLDFRGTSAAVGEDGTVFWRMNRYENQELAYNGQRLAVSGWNWVQIYDKTGHLFTGYCDLSVEQQGVNYYHHPQQLRWEK